MKWLEVIELRSSKHGCKSLEKDIRDIMDAVECKGEEEPLTITFFKHGAVDNDFCIHLSYDNEKANPAASPLGLCLAKALKDFGLVNYKIWIEKCSCSYQKAGK